MKAVDIYTDGSCKKNPGPGGWGAILVYKGKEKELCGGEADTTNNRMELTAVIRALEALREPCSVTLISDSRYVCDGMGKGWAKAWKKRGWKKADGTPVLNQDLWLQLDALYGRHQVTFHWVRGHVGIDLNERCDQLAKSEAMRFIRKS